MATLTIDGIDYQGKCNFAFDLVADEKYNEEDAKGNKIGGFMNIYMKLLGDDLKGLLAFWDCACADYGKKRPSQKDIEIALMAIIDDEETGEAETDKLFKDAFKAIHNSGFYRKPKNNLWKQFQKMEEAGETDEDKEKNKASYQELVKTKDAQLE